MSQWQQTRELRNKDPFVWPKGSKTSVTTVFILPNDLMKYFKAIYKDHDKSDLSLWKINKFPTDIVSV